jgi:hypothetical protein
MTKYRAKLVFSAVVEPAAKREIIRNLSLLKYQPDCLIFKKNKVVIVYEVDGGNEGLSKSKVDEWATEVEKELSKSGSKLIKKPKIQKR